MSYKVDLTPNFSVVCYVECELPSKSKFGLFYKSLSCNHLIRGNFYFGIRGLRNI